MVTSLRIYELSPKCVTEGKRSKEVTGRRGIRSEQLLVDLEEKREYCKLRHEKIERNLRRTGFIRGYEPVVIQTTNE